MAVPDCKMPCSDHASGSFSFVKTFARCLGTHFLYLYYVSSDFSFICFPPLSVLDALPELFCHGIYFHFGLLSLLVSQMRYLLDALAESPRSFSSSLISVCLPVSIFFVVCTNCLAGLLVCPTTCHKRVPKFLAKFASSTHPRLRWWSCEHHCRMGCPGLSFLIVCGYKSVT